MTNTTKPTKATNMTAILALDTGWDEKSLKALSAPDVAGLLALLEYVMEEGGEELLSIEGSKIRQKYRARYAEIAKARGHIAKTVGGRATLNNGDDLALLLESASPQDTCSLWDALSDQADGTTYALYTIDRIGQLHPKTGLPLKALNDGMVRMNAGNRIRSLCRKLPNPAMAISRVRALLDELTDMPAILQEQSA